MKRVAIYGLALLGVAVVAGAVVLQAQTNRACPVGGTNTSSGEVPSCCAATATETAQNESATSAEMPACGVSEGSGAAVCGGAMAGSPSGSGPFGQSCPYLVENGSERSSGGGCCGMGGLDKQGDNEKGEEPSKPDVVEAKEVEAQPGPAAKAN